MNARGTIEHALRALAVGALALAAWRRLAPDAVAAAPLAPVVDERALPTALARWTASATPNARVALDSLPDARTRAWLAALGAAGTRVEWRAGAAPALAASAEPPREPAGGVQLAIAAPTGAGLVTRDALGPLDSVSAAGGGARLTLPSAAAGVQVRTAGGSARVDAPAAVRTRAVLVLAVAGWEGKFVAAALEEAGWPVRTRFVVGPGVVVGSERGTGAPALDTATLAAVVALDSSATALAAPIAAYVRRGGGLVLAGEAALASGLALLAAAALDAPIADASLVGDAAAPGDEAATVRPLTRPRADAVPLASRTVAGRRVLVAAARRVGPGRVVQLAGEESWRRRLAGGDGAPEAHRAAWSRAVAAAAYVPAAPIAANGSPLDSPLEPPRREPAPLAATVAALGPAADAPWPATARATARAVDRPAPGPRPSEGVLVGLALAALVTEVASRRWRGQP